MRHTGINMEVVKRRNRVSILNCILDKGAISRKDIAGITGLTPAAVTQICNEFMEQGLLIETGIQAKNKGAGRKKVLVDLYSDYRYILAITIEPEYTTVALANIRGDLVEKRRRKTEVLQPAIDYLTTVAKDGKELIKCHSELSGRITGGCVGITGLVDKEKGSSVKAYGIWEEEVPVCERLSDELGIPFVIENNVNALAEAELLYGAGRSYDNLLVLKWGPGVGSTIIIDHEIYEGRHQKAAEIGHFIIEKEGERCSCGRRGCLETKISFFALASKVKKELQEEFYQEEFGIIYRRLVEEKKSGCFDEAIDLFARTIVNTVTILAPNRVILTGILFQDEFVRTALIEACKSYDESVNESRILYSDLSEKEDYIGPIAVYVRNEIIK